MRRLQWYKRGAAYEPLTFPGEEWVKSGEEWRATLHPYKSLIYKHLNYFREE